MPNAQHRTGRLADGLTRLWVRLTGRRVDLARSGWLDGPTGDPHRVGDGWLAAEVARAGGTLSAPTARTGLLPTMAALDGPGFSAAALQPEVRSFYEETSRWRLQVWSQWSPLAWPAGWLVSAVFSRRLEQLSLPLRPLDVAYGMSSEVRAVTGRAGDPVGTVWHRRLRSTGATVFSGWYGLRTLPGASRPSVRVVFPLPHGRLVVLLRPSVTAAGALELTSTSGAWGTDGAYLVVQRAGSPTGWARRVPVHERFHVFVDDEGVLRTDHRIDLGRVPVLRLHYRLDRTSPDDDGELLRGDELPDHR